jgi:hypothetical protein
MVPAAERAIPHAEELDAIYLTERAGEKTVSSFTKEFLETGTGAISDPTVPYFVPARAGRPGPGFRVSGHVPGTSWGQGRVAG